MLGLKQLREEKNLTLKEVANKLSCNKQTYWNYEKGIRKIPLERAILLAKLFNITVEKVYILSSSNQNVNNIKIVNEKAV